MEYKTTVVSRIDHKVAPTSKWFSLVKKWGHWSSKSSLTGSPWDKAHSVALVFCFVDSPPPPQRN